MLVLFKNISVLATYRQVTTKTTVPSRSPKLSIYVGDYSVKADTLNTSILDCWLVF